MDVLEQLVLPGLIVAIILLTIIAMRGDKRARKRIAEATRDSKTSAQSGFDEPPERPSRTR